MFSKNKQKTQQEEEEDDEPTSSSQPFNPTRTFYIVPHSGFTKTIQIFDLTGQPKTSHLSESDFRNEIKDLVQKTAPSSWLTITRTPHWYSKTFLIHKPTTSLEAEAEPIATWKAGLFTTSSNTISFPPNSPYSSHTITLNPSSVWKFREQFVKDSVTYEWKPDNAFTNKRKFTLYRVIGKERAEIGRYLQGRSIKYGGVLVVDDREVGDVVAVLSMVSVLRKKRQKDSESHSGGGGG